MISEAFGVIVVHHVPIDGKDGLGGIHTSVDIPSLRKQIDTDAGQHPHHTPAEDIWKDLFKAPPSDTLLTSSAIQDVDVDLNSRTSLFTPSHRPSHLEILRILDENPPDTVTVIAIGPLTNLALATSHAPTTLMRAKSILVMGGTISEPGNITPVSEFNTYADTVAAARLYALTSPNPASTMPPVPPPTRSQIKSSNDEPPPPPFLPPYPSKHELGPRRLRVILFPLDITTSHSLRRDEVEAKVKPLIEKGSPLAEWTSAFLDSTFDKIESLHHGHEGGSTVLSLHDPLCVWYALTAENPKEGWTVCEGEDVRVETSGQWTRGMCVIDRRDRKRRDGDDGEEGEVPGDTGNWLSSEWGNRLGRCIGTPGERALAPFLLDKIFG